MHEEKYIKASSQAYNRVKNDIMMKYKLAPIYYFLMLILSSFVFMSFAWFKVFASPLTMAINKVGTFPSQNSQCRALLERSGMGGFLKLNISLTTDVHLNKVIDDVTGILWTKSNILIFSVSPIYGKPGIYLFNCKSMQLDRLVSPTNFDKGYPDGTDYFELQGYSEDLKEIYFYYSTHVDKTDFSRFRTKTFLYKVNLDGLGLGKLSENKK